MNSQLPARVKMPIAVLATAGLLGVLDVRPAAAEDADTDRVENVETVVAVAMPENFPVGSVMRANCAFVVRVQFPDGSARETQSCTLSDEPVMIPENQGVPPDTAFHHSTGPCEWVSDYWYATNETIVYADSSRIVVMPSGVVHATSTYPAEPLACD